MSWLALCEVLRIGLASTLLNIGVFRPITAVGCAKKNLRAKRRILLLSLLFAVLSRNISSLFFCCSQETLGWDKSDSYTDSLRGCAHSFTRGSVEDRRQQLEDQHEWFTVLGNAVSYANNHRPHRPAQPAPKRHVVHDDRMAFFSLCIFLHFQTHLKGRVL